MPGVLAFREVGAGDKNPVAADFFHQLPLALGTVLADGHRLGWAPAGGERLGGLAVGVTRAGQERPEAPALEHHLAVAVVAVLGLAFGGVFVRLDAGNFQGGLAGVGAVGIAGAGQEEPVATDAHQHGLAAALAGLVGGQAGLDVFHLLAGAFQVAGEFFVEL